MSDQVCSICLLPLENPVSVPGFRAVHPDCLEAISSGSVTAGELRGVARVVRAYQCGTQNRWVAALQARRVVGRYQRGATLKIARALHVSASQVENLAMAGTLYRWLYKEAQKFGVVSEIQRVRAVLPMSHWVTLAEAMRRYAPVNPDDPHPISPVDAMRLLSMAVGEHLTVIDFSRAIDLEFKPRDELAAEAPLDLGATDDVPRISDTLGQRPAGLEAVIADIKKGQKAGKPDPIVTMVRFSQWAGDHIARIVVEFEADDLIPVGARVLVQVVQAVGVENEK